MCEDVEGMGVGVGPPQAAHPVSQGQRSTRLPAVGATGSGGSRLQLHCLHGNTSLLA